MANTEKKPRNQEQRNADEAVGRRVRALRDISGHSQTELAMKLVERGHSFTQQAVLNLEQGRRTLKYTEALSLADIFGVGADELTDEPEGEMHAIIKAKSRVVVAELEEKALAMAKAQRDFLDFMEDLPQVIRELDNEIPAAPSGTYMPALERLIPDMYEKALHVLLKSKKSLSMAEALTSDTCGELEHAKASRAAHHAPDYYDCFRG